jgi:proline dehydrogenase
MLSFNNTQIAFSSRTDKDLRRAFLMFRMVEDPALVKLGKYATPFAFKIGLPIKSLVKATIFHQFCGGENIEECKKTVEDLGKFNIGTILDYSVEGKHEETDLDATTQEIIRTAEIAKGNPAIPFCVFKVTGVARFELLEKVSAQNELSAEEKEEFQRVSNRVNKICKAAFDADTPVFIDADGALQ